MVAADAKAASVQEQQPLSQIEDSPTRTIGVANHIGQAKSEESSADGRKPDAASRIGAEPVEQSPAGALQERGAGTVSSSTLQPAKSKTTAADLELSRPAPSERVQPLPGHDLVDTQARTSGAGNPDYESMHEVQGLRAGPTHTGSNRSGPGANRGAPSSDPRRTEETPRIPHPELGIQEDLPLASRALRQATVVSPQFLVDEVELVQSGKKDLHKLASTEDRFHASPASHPEPHIVDQAEQDAGG